jgi:hypothetical protein
MDRLIHFLLIAFLQILMAVANYDDDDDLGVSLGSSAASKLLRNILDSQLRSPRFIELGLNSADKPWFDFFKYFVTI